MLRLAAVAALFAMCSASAAAPMPVAAKAADPLTTARKALDETTDFTYQGRSLNDVFNDLRNKTKLPVTLDTNLMQFGLNADMPLVNVNQKDVKVRDGLKAVLAPLNLRFGLTRDGLFISTEDGVVAKQLRQRVSVDCNGTPFVDAMKQLAADTGANVVVDPRLKEKASAATTLKLDDVPLDTAVKLLAEVADLRAIRMSNVLFITTPERADKLRPDADGPLPAAPAHGFFPMLNPPPVQAFGGVAFPAQAIPALQVVPAPAPAQDLPAPAPEKK